MDYTKEPPMINVTVRVPVAVLEKAKELRLNVSRIVRDAIAREVNAQTRKKSQSA